MSLNGIDKIFSLASEAAAAASIRYPGILSNYDYRQMTPESLLAESERLIEVRDPESYRKFNNNFHAGYDRGV